MAQVKVYGVAERPNPIKGRLSDVIHSCVVDALRFPPDKKAHRFFTDGPRRHLHTKRPGPDGYTIIEISLFEGRTVEAKKHLTRLLFERIDARLGIAPTDVEITITETPKHNWGFLGQTGDEITLKYKIKV